MVHPVESVEERGQRRIVGHIEGLPPGGAAQLLRGRGEAVRRTPTQDDLRSGGDGLVGHTRSPMPDPPPIRTTVRSLSGPSGTRRSDGEDMRHTP